MRTVEIYGPAAYSVKRKTKLPPFPSSIAASKNGKFPPAAEEIWPEGFRRIKEKFGR